MLYYSHILSGHEATEDNAKEHAKHFDFTQDETREEDLKYMNYIDTIKGIEIYYCYGADVYMFAPTDQD